VKLILEGSVPEQLEQANKGELVSHRLTRRKTAVERCYFMLCWFPKPLFSNKHFVIATAAYSSLCPMNSIKTLRE